MSRRPSTTTTTTPLRRHGRALLAAATGIACVAALGVAPASAAVNTLDRSGPESRIPVLKGIVGPGFTISINDDSVRAGKYKLIVNDKGTIHNFHILGAGVDKATSVPGTGRTKFRIRLKPGTYTIQCDPHAAEMNTVLTVT